jgi:hypothetical protein
LIKKSPKTAFVIEKSLTRYNSNTFVRNRNRIEVFSLQAILSCFCSKFRESHTHPVIRIRLIVQSLSIELSPLLSSNCFAWHFAFWYPNELPFFAQGPKPLNVYTVQNPTRQVVLKNTSQISTTCTQTGRNLSAFYTFTPASILGVIDMFL